MRETSRERIIGMRIVLALLLQRFRPGLHGNVFRFQTRGEIPEVRLTVSLPDAGEVGFAVRGSRRGCRKIGLTVCCPWDSRSRQVQPLSTDRKRHHAQKRRCVHKNSRGDLHIVLVDSAPLYTAVALSQKLQSKKKARPFNGRAQLTWTQATQV